MSVWKGLMEGALSKLIYELIVKPFVPILLSSLLAVITIFLKRYAGFFTNVSEITIAISIASLSIIPYIIYRTYLFGKKRYQLISNSGLFYFDRNVASEDKLKNEEFLKTQVKKAKNIEIIGATGYNTFAREDIHGKAVLRDEFEKATGEIKVLLLNPNSLQTKMRANALGVPLDN